MFGVALFCGFANAQTSTPTPPAQNPTTTEPFHSPVNDKKEPQSGEAEDFAKLVPLYDKWEASEDALHQTRACGTKEEIAAAEAAWHAAWTAYHGAVRAYIYAYSSTAYPQEHESHFHGELKDAFILDFYKVERSIKRLSKYAHVAVAPCPPKPQAAAPPATQTPALAVPPCYDAAAQADLVKSEMDLADLNKAVDKAQGEVDDDKAKLKRSQDAYGPNNPDVRKATRTPLTRTFAILAKFSRSGWYLRSHIDFLKSLNSCPLPGNIAPHPVPGTSAGLATLPPAKPSKTSNDERRTRRITWPCHGRRGRWGR